jgi:DNA-binding MurR/RpiR family transcriptional regulator
MAIRITTADLTKTDRKVAGVQLSHYPVVGFQALAEVSAKPVIHTRSIIRCVKLLGFVCYPKFLKSIDRGIDK